MSIDRLRRIARILSRAGMYLSDFVFVITLIQNRRDFSKTSPRDFNRSKTKKKKTPYFDFPEVRK